MDYIDLRSDTVTRPSPEMRHAIAGAVVGDDVWGDDPTVNYLQDKVAELFGKEASLFVPSGTMGNQVSLKTISEPGWEIICERGCHIINYESGGPAYHSGLMIQPIDTDRGVFNAGQVESYMRPANIHHPRPKIVAIENTHNRHGGTIFPLDEIIRIRTVADRHDLIMHLDGARIWNAHIATGIALAEWAAPFDTISVCLSKGLGAPVGSMIIGSRGFIEKARRTRKLFGGGMRQAGILAAAGLYAIDNNIERLAEDHANARVLAEGLAGIDGWKIELDRVETNIIIADCAGTGRSSEEMGEQMKQKGVLAGPFGKTKIRFVTHLDVTAEQCRKAVDLIADIR
jgi:threonine aldolase